MRSAIWTGTPSSGHHRDKVSYNLPVIQKSWNGTEYFCRDEVLGYVLNTRGKAKEISTICDKVWLAALQ